MELNKLKDNKLSNAVDLIFNEGSFLRDKLKQHFENQKYQVEIEHPTRFELKNGRADLIVTYEKPHYIIKFVIEVKKLDKEHSGLVCLGNLVYLPKMKINIIGSTHEDPQNKIQSCEVDFSRNLPFTTELYQVGEEELNRKKQSDVTVDHSGKQIKTLMQIYENTISYLFEESQITRNNLERVGGNEFRKFSNIIIIPLIITNTDINLIDANINNYDIINGKSEDTINMFKTVDFVGIKFSLNTVELNRLDNKYQDIFVVSTKNLDSFIDLVKLQIENYYSRYKFIVTNFTKEELVKINRGYDEKYLTSTYHQVWDNFNKHHMIMGLQQHYKTNYFINPWPIDDSELENLLNERFTENKELFKLCLFLAEIITSEKYVNLQNNIILQELMWGKYYYQLLIDLYDYLSIDNVNKLILEEN